MTKLNENVLRDLYGDVSSVAAVKTIDYLDNNCLSFIENSTFCVLATSDGLNLDVSPKGDPAGFVTVLDKKTLVIPDRPGNNRIDGLLNLLKYPKIGLLFLIPSVDEAFLHCGKAPLRAGLWKPKTWPVIRPVPNLYEMVKGHAKGHKVPDLSQDQIEFNYKKTLY